jgi:putative glutamine amidotransferase
MYTEDRPAVVAVTAPSETVGGRVRVRVNAAYTQALAAAGLVPLVVPPLRAPGAAAAAILAAVAGLVVTGGEDVDPACYGADTHPALGAVNAERDATEIALVRAARERGLPTLAICRGVQLLNVALGGTLFQDLPTERPGTGSHDPADAARSARTHPVRVEPGSRLAGSLGCDSLHVNSLHHQALDRVAPALRATAHAPDGVIEGAESADPAAWWAVGVQWHPEELIDTAEPWDRALFAAFAAEVRGRRG